MRGDGEAWSCYFCENCPFGMAKFEVHYIRYARFVTYAMNLLQSSCHNVNKCMCFRIGKYKEFLNKYSVTSSQGEFRDECDLCHLKFSRTFPSILLRDNSRWMWQMSLKFSAFLGIILWRMWPLSFKVSRNFPSILMCDLCENNFSSGF